MRNSSPADRSQLRRIGGLGRWERLCVALIAALAVSLASLGCDKDKGPGDVGLSGSTAVTGAGEPRNQSGAPNMSGPRSGTGNNPPGVIRGIGNTESGLGITTQPSANTSGNPSSGAQEGGGGATGSGTSTGNTQGTNR